MIEPVDGWCCIDCTMLLANGETPPEMDEEETAAYLARIPDFPRATLGNGTDSCGCDDWNTDEHRYGCEHVDFSSSRCDVCGSTLGGSRDAVTFWITTRDVKTVLTSYVECALWSSFETTKDGDMGEPLDSWATVDDIAPEALEEMRADVIAFTHTADEIAGCEWWTDEQLGHDFWLTRNHHGAGFWDRGQGEAGDKLTAMCEPYGSCDLYTGDDGQVYVG